jgi:hypothetical protein
VHEHEHFLADLALDDQVLVRAHALGAEERRQAVQRARGEVGEEGDRAQHVRLPRLAELAAQHIGQPVQPRVRLRGARAGRSADGSTRVYEEGRGVQARHLHAAHTHVQQDARLHRHDRVEVHDRLVVLQGAEARCVEEGAACSPSAT